MLQWWFLGLFSASSGEVELISDALFDCAFDLVFFELYSVLLTFPDPSNNPLGDSDLVPTGLPMPMLNGLSFAATSGDYPENSLSSSSLVAINIGSTRVSSWFFSNCFLCWQYLHRQKSARMNRIIPMISMIPKKAHFTRIPVIKAPMTSSTCSYVHSACLFTKSRGMNFPYPLVFSARFHNLSLKTWKL